MRETTWRPTPLLRAGAWVLVIANGAFAGLTARSAIADGAAAVLAMAVLYGVPGLGFYRLARHCRLTLTDTTLTVVNLAKPKQVAIREVTDATPGYSGIEVTLRDGSTVVGWAVQKSNLATWAGRRTAADDVAAEILRRAHNAASDSN